MNILHINTRYDEGGAAQVALNLHERLLAGGHESHYVYGYGKHTLDNPRAKSNTHKLTSSIVAISNFLSHRLIGTEPFTPSLTHLDHIVNGETIVHIHNLHSHVTSITPFLEFLHLRCARVVWTTHDRWVLTGRCALPGDCEKWASGCGSCPNQKAYPPSILDFSNRIHIRKREVIAKTCSTFVSPSSHLAEDLRRGYPAIPINVVNNGYDIEFEKLAAQVVDAGKTSPPKPPSKHFNLIIVANDLSDSNKLDSTFIKRLEDQPSIRLHTIGKASPFHHPNTVNHGYISERSKLLEIMSGMDAMLFLSTVDNFPLVLCESLAVGLPILALESAAANEVLSPFGIATYRTTRELFNELMSADFRLYLQKLNKDRISDFALNRFSGGRMLNEYLGIYTG